MKNLIRLARPWHWIKNVFVLVPVPFALVADQSAVATFDGFAFLSGLLGFCLTNSAVYVFNDLCDASADRLHPRKRLRPIAAGAVTVATASVYCGGLAIAGLVLCQLSGRGYATVIAGLYLVINIAYSVKLKHVPIVDVFTVSSGFVLRVLLGCVLIAAAPSNWVLLCSSSLALLLSFCKRRADLATEYEGEYRPALEGYSLGFLDQAITVTAGMALLSYTFYCIDAGSPFVQGRELASLPLVAMGILYYLRLVRDEGGGGSPVADAYGSLPLQLCAGGWVAAVAWSLGLIG